MFTDKNGELLDRRLYKEKAVICIFIQLCVGRPSPQFQSNQHNDQYCIWSVDFKSVKTSEDH